MNDGNVPELLSRHVASCLFNSPGTWVRSSERRLGIAKRQRNGGRGTARPKIEDPVACFGRERLENLLLPASIAHQDNERGVVNQLGNPIAKPDEHPTASCFAHGLTTDVPRSSQVTSTSCRRPGHTL